MTTLNPYAAPMQPAFYPTLLGDLELVTATSGRAVSRDEVRTHCRVDTDADDALIDGLIQAATLYCEQSIDGHRQILTATYDLPVADWWDGELKLPRPPLSSVTSIKYFDSGGTQQTLATTVYLTAKPMRQPGRIERAPNQSWPALQGDRRWPITIRFVAGYGAASAVPQTLKQAILLLVGHWYEHRESVVTGTISASLEFAVRALLDSEGYGNYA